MVTFTEYSQGRLETSIYPVRPSFGIRETPLYPFLGLAGETGEVIEKLKKYIRDGSGPSVLQSELLGELGDVLWYLDACAYEMGYSLEDVATANLEKLASRKERGVLHGSGDNR